MIPEKLKYGDEIRVIAPSRSLSAINKNTLDNAIKYWQSKNFKITFSENCQEVNDFNSSSIKSRVKDMHDAFRNPNVKMIITAIGGFNSNQILKFLDYDLFKKNPKIICGFSDITVLLNAIYNKTGLVTYHGPHFSTFAFVQERGYTENYFKKCLMSSKTFSINPSNQINKYDIIQNGCCEGTIIGGNLCSLNLLQGTEYIPDIKDKVLFIEDDNIMGDYFVYEFDRNIQSLLQQTGADTVKGIVFGKFDDSCKMNRETITEIIKDKINRDIPVLFRTDFGHMYPMITFPIGGKAKICTYNGEAKIEITSH